MAIPKNPVVWSPLSNDQITKMLAESRPMAGYHAFLCVKAEAHESKDEEKINLVSRLTFRMLSDPNDSNSVEGPSVSHWQVWPLSNPDYSDHTPPARAGEDATRLLGAFFPDEIVAWPSRVDGKMHFKGEEISRDQEAGAKIECLNLTTKKAAEVYNDHSQLVGRVVYAALSYDAKQTGDGPAFPRLGKWDAEPARELSAERVEEITPVLPEPATKAPAGKKGGRK